jgi:hypothetical protein
MIHTHTFMTKLFSMLFLAAFMSVYAAYAQGSGDETPMTPEEIEETVRGLGDRTTILEGDVEKLKQIKISGYVQTEWQHYDQKTSLGGRALYSDSRKNLFTIRRGRLKVQHKLGVMKSVIQADFTERGVELKDAYAEFELLPEGEFLVDVGQFNRPNYEVELSSSARESPERSQVVRAFYPGERDLGFMFTYQPALTETFDPKLQLALFNGVGPSPETDAYKDFMTRLSFPLPLGEETPIHIDLGGSFYYGGIPQTSDSILKTVDGRTIMAVNDETGSMAGWGNRQNFGLEGQVYLDVLPFGGTILKGEYLAGQRPTGATAATSASVGVGKDSNGEQIPVVVPGTAGKPLQLRDQSGYYLYLVQNIGTRFQLAAKYDYFDRNTGLEGSQVTSASDAAFSVLGFGANFFVDNLRITAWYEIPTAESGAFASGSITPEDAKDNKTTIRFQYKF